MSDSNSVELQLIDHVVLKPLTIAESLRTTLNTIHVKPYILSATPMMTTAEEMLEIQKLLLR